MWWRRRRFIGRSVEDRLKEQVPTHVRSGIQCLVIHPDGDGPCIACARCGEFIRPRDFRGVCLGQKEK
jgi:hypothetical protein